MVDYFTFDVLQNFLKDSRNCNEGIVVFIAKTVVHTNIMTSLAFLNTILIWLDSFPLLSQRTRTVLYSPDISTSSKPRPPVLTAVSRVNFLFSFFHKKDISWVIIGIEIKMRLGDKFDRSMTLGKLLGNNALLFIFIS